MWEPYCNNCNDASEGVYALAWTYVITITIIDSFYYLYLVSNGYLL